MPTTSRVFVDTNVFVALRDTKDSTHKLAVLLYKKFKLKKIKLLTSSDVIGETITVLARKLGKQSALDFLKTVSSLYQVIFIDTFLHKESLNLFKRVKSKTISFIDYSSAVAMKRHKIKAIFSFDNDFKKLGVKLTPEVF